MSKLSLNSLNKLFTKADHSEDDKIPEVPVIEENLCKKNSPTQLENVTKKSSSNLEIHSPKSALSSTSETILTKSQEFDSKPGEYDNYLHIPGGSKSMNFAQDMEFYDFSRINVPNSTVCVVGSNPGEPKKCFNDPPTRKTQKNVKKRKDKKKEVIPRKAVESSRSIMKHDKVVTPGDCLAEELNGSNDVFFHDPGQLSGQLTLDFTPYSKQSNYKSVSFNSEVIIFHFIGDSRVEKTVQTLSKEQDQQARNFEFRKRYFAKYKAFFP